MTRNFPRSTRLSLLFVLAAGLAQAKAGEFSFHHENVLGTSLEIRVDASTPEAARDAESRVLAEIDRLATTFSGYDSTSEFSRWMKDGKNGKVSPELFEVLAASDRWRTITEGAFDPRVEALTRLWSAAVKNDRLPSDAEIQAARALMSAPAWTIDASGKAAARSSSSPVSLNAIAKGYIVEKSCRAALASNVKGALVAIGGDMRALGSMTRRVGIARPRGDSESTEPVVTIELRDEALATSGDYLRGFKIGGLWYSHIFDPKTGRPASRVMSSSVIAPTADQADALATAFSVLPVEKSLAIADSLPGTACLLLSADGKAFRSRDWSRHERARVRLTGLSTNVEAKPAAEGEAWPKGFELAVNFEINQVSGDARRYRRPYVAVWITDKDGFPVKTLVLWIQRTGTRWLPDLTRWYRDDQVRKLADDTDLVQTVSRATRAAGRYDVIWDGKDDHGKQVAAGTYTLNVEAAREHGTHQIIRKEIVLGDKPLSEELKGNVEIKSASYTYGKRKSAR